MDTQRQRSSRRPISLCAHDEHQVNTHSTPLPGDEPVPPRIEARTGTSLEVKFTRPCPTNSRCHERMPRRGESISCNVGEIPPRSDRCLSQHCASNMFDDSRHAPAAVYRIPGYSLLAEARRRFRRGRQPIRPIRRRSVASSTRICHPAVLRAVVGRASQKADSD